MYRVDVGGAGARKLAILPNQLRQDLLLELGKLGSLADEQGLQGFAPTLNLWMDYGTWRVLYTLDLRKQVLALVDLVEKA